MIIIVNKNNPNAVSEFLKKNPKYVIVNEKDIEDGKEIHLEEAIDFEM